MLFNFNIANVIKYLQPVPKSSTSFHIHTISLVSTGFFIFLKINQKRFVYKSEMIYLCVTKAKIMNNQDIINLMPNYCDTLTTKEIAAKLGISTNKAYILCCKAEAEGMLFKFGYKDRTGVTLPVEDNTKRNSSLIWQNTIAG